MHALQLMGRVGAYQVIRLDIQLSLGTILKHISLIN